MQENKKTLFIGLTGLFLMALTPVWAQDPAVTTNEYPLPTPDSLPGGIIVGPDDAIWFVETGANQIGRITADGQITEYPVPTADAIDERQGFLAVGPDGAIWFNQDVAGSLGRITTEGEITEFPLPEGTGAIRALVPAEDGALWLTAADANAVLRFLPGEGVTDTYPISDGADPVGMVTTSDGTMWFVDPGENAVGRVTKEGEITMFGLPSPKVGRYVSPWDQTTRCGLPSSVARKLAASTPTAPSKSSRWAR